jgi:xylan 1,4-beta-xylosidase
MGSPQRPSAAQVKKLEKAGQLEVLGKPTELNVQKGKATISFTLPRQGVALLKLDWKEE